MLDYRKSQPGDHDAAECAAARAAHEARDPRAVTSDDDARGYHAGWGICAGTVIMRAYDAEREEVEAFIDRPATSPFVQRALAGLLPVKEYAR